MRGKKRSKMLSLLLAIVLAVGMVPLSALPVNAKDMALATDDYSQWMNIGNHTAPDGTKYGATSETWYKNMVKALESAGSNTKIRLQSDISVEFNSHNTKDWIGDVNVKGNNVIDLNGKTLYMKPYNYLRGGRPYHFTIFQIKDGAKLTIVDSKGGGKIACDTWICDANDTFADTACVDMFHVSDGGELEINASGATFECGRSKKQWMYAACCNGPEDEYCYDGYARNQANGSVIVAGTNSKVSIYGGALLARGYSYTPYTGWNPRPDTGKVKKCAVFQMKRGASINITDGYFKGCGGADVFQTYYQNDVNVQIKAGTFDTHKVDKVVIEGYVPESPDAGDLFKGFTHHNYMPGRYGEVNILQKWVNMEEADLIYGGEELAEKDGDVTGSKKTIIRPKSDYGSRVKINDRDTGETNAYNPNEDKPYVFDASYEPYFTPEEEEKLAFDYQDRTDRTITWGFWVQDGFSIISEKMESTAPVCDVNQLRTTKGKKIDYKPGKRYKLVMQVEEKWVGHNTHTRTFDDYYIFFISDAPVAQVSEVMHFNVDTTIGVKGDPQNFVVYPDNATLDRLEQLGLTDKTETSYKYIYYYINKYGKQKKSESQSIGSGRNLKAHWCFTPLQPGPLELTLQLFIQGSDENDVCAVEEVQKIFAMPSISVRRDGSSQTDFVVPDINEVVTAVTGKTVTLDPGFEFLKEFDFKDPMTQKKLSIEDVKWEFRELGGSGYQDLTGVTVDKNGRCSVDQNGTYRAKFDYNGKTWYSPNPVLVSGKDYDSTRMPYITGKSSHRNWTDPHYLQINLNKDANWYTVTEYLIKLQSRPKGAPAKSSQIKCDSDGKLDMNRFFYTNNFVPGDYTFVAYVYGKDKYGNSYRERSEPFYVKMEKESSGNYLTVNGEMLSDPSRENSNFPYMVPAGVTKLNFEHKIYPSDSTIDSYWNYTYKWFSSDPQIVNIDSDTGQAEALRPGSATVGYRIYNSSGAVCQENSVRVDVPIAGFEVEQIDYTDYIGQSYTSIKPVVKSVWSASGLKITEETDKYLDFDIWNFTSSGMSSAEMSKVAYNDYVRFTYRVHAKEGYFMVMKKDYKSSSTQYYSVDTAELETNGFSGDTVIRKAVDLGADPAYVGGSENYYRITTFDKNTNAYSFEEGGSTWSKAIFPVTVFVRNPDVQYLKTINFSTREPVKNDYRYEGDDWAKGYYTHFMKLNITNLKGIKTVYGRDMWSYSSRVSKLDGDPKGSGNPYEDADAESSIEWYDVIRDVFDAKQKPTARYDDGIYVNALDVQLSSDETAAGQKFSIAPDVKVFLNGHEIDFAGVYYNFGGEPRVIFKYYFDVGNVESFTQATVKGIRAPRAGEKMTSAEDTYVEESGDLYVSNLTWFVDKNGNHSYDVGEECRVRADSSGNYDPDKSELAEDGTFRVDRKYSVFVEVSSEKGRIANGGIFQLYMTQENGAEALLSVDNAPNGTYAFQKTFVSRFDATLREGEPHESYRFNEIPSGATHGFSVDSYWVKDEETGESMVSKELQPGRKYRFGITYKAAPNNSFADDFKVSVEGKELTDGVTVSKEKDNVHIEVVFTMTATGVEVSGSAVSFQSETEPVTLQLIEQGKTDVFKETTVSGGTKSGNKYTVDYAFTEVPAGTYTLNVMKKNHVTREYTVTVGTDPVKQDVVIQLLGDVNGDGKVNMKDWNNVYAHVNKTTELKDYALKCAEVSGDKKINMKDWNRIYAHVNKTKLLW